MLSPKPEAVAKYQSLCPGYKQFAVVEEYELPNFPGWEVLKIFVTKEQVLDIDEGVSIDAWNCNEPATSGGYIQRPKQEKKVKIIEVRRYLIGLKETDVLDKLAKELIEKEKEIRDLRLQQIKYEYSIKELGRQNLSLMSESAESRQSAERIASRIADLEDEIRELKKQPKENGIIYGETEEIKPAIRHLDLED